ncbi:hypothetical protein EDB85DRAFT_1866625 [Lactarius pseudohatsudake]|nr:hypothetical protein EDB85DRAFT_1866625 [Lactarius pseudohatsudake]
MQSVNTDDNNDNIEYIRTLPSSDAIAPALQDPSPLIALGPPVISRHVSEKLKCKQHVVSAPPSQTGISTYPFLLHVKEHTTWEFSSHSGTLLLHACRCENCNLNKCGLCQPCHMLLSNTKFRNILVQIKIGVNENTPYKFHGLMNMTKIA